MFVLVAGGIWLLWALQGILLLLLFAMFFAYFLAPLVEQLQNRTGLARGTCVALVYVAIFAVAGLTAVAFLPRLGSQLEELMAQAPEYLSAARNSLTLDPRRVPEPMRALTLQTIAQAVQRAHVHAEQVLLEAIAMARFVPYLVVVPILGFFFLKDAEGFRASALRILPAGRVRWRARDVLDDMNRALANYVRAQLVSGGVISIIACSAYALIGLPYALVVGVCTGLAELVPLLGPIASITLAVLVATLGGDGVLLRTSVFLVALRVTQDFIVFPRLVGKGANLHPLAIILAIMCSSQLFGFGGLFLAVPLITLLTVGYRHFSPANVETAAPAVSSPGLVRDEPGRLEGVRVVVVDNEPDALALLTHVLERSGATVCAATDAQQALDLISSRRPHVLVSDLGMPTEDGFELMTKVRALDDIDCRNTPAIALTGYTMPEDRRRALNAGFQAHVSKPVDPEALIDVVADLAVRPPIRLAAIRQTARPS